ncbi:Na+/H+ antiporter NhaA [Frigidibacter sp. MR17.14]|uniref:Na+/H+ antiporter NhaA n=1 Tax=Frigidibacter sp. MR17.14 TaxID=3126509 RepID=UPI003012BAFE
MYKVWKIINNYSLLLIGGAILALVWANVSPDSYHHFVHYPLIENFFIGQLEEVNGETHRVLTVHYLFNDVLMALFFAIAAKEVWEAIILEEGSLRGRKAATPLIATLGGMAGPVVMFFALAFILWPATVPDVAHGWAIPTATDIAFSYLVGRLVFGAGHPAIRFLLLLAIADDAGGLLILAIFYPTGELAPQWLILSFGVCLAVFLLFNWLPRKLDGDNLSSPRGTWVRENLGSMPYLIAGAISWYAFQEAGIHPALGLLPLIPAIPHADQAYGFFAQEEENMTDLLNRLEHALKVPVQLVLFGFGLSNAGVEFAAIGEPTWLVLFGLLLGKPLGIFLMGWIAAYPLRLGLPEGMNLRDLLALGCVAAIGFTVALFVASVAFPAGEVQDAAKMGALFSFGAAAVSLVVGKLVGVRKVHD